MMSDFICWKCGGSLQGVILPMSRREECTKCSADQHVCKMCMHFDDRGRCDEELAEDVSNKERANFCDYFKPSIKEFKGIDKQKSDKAKAQLAELFGEPIPQEVVPDETLTPAELAEKKLREMLNN